MHENSIRVQKRSNHGRLITFADAMLENLLTPYIPERFLKDERYRRWHIGAIAPLPGVKVLGLHTPDLKKIATGIVRESQASATASKPDHKSGHETPPPSETNLPHEIHPPSEENLPHAVCPTSEEQVPVQKVRSDHRSGQELYRSSDENLPHAVCPTAEDRASALIRAFQEKQEKDSRSGLLYEEKMIWGLMLNRMPMSMEERLEAFSHFIPAIDNWAVCDTVCADARWCRKDRDAVWQFLQPWFRSERDFDIRFALVLSLGHFLDEEHIGELFALISALADRKIRSDYPAQSYYADMAAAWLMATALFRFPEQTRHFAASAQCPGRILRLYLRKARESCRTRQMKPLP